MSQRAPAIVGLAILMGLVSSQGLAGIVQGPLKDDIFAESVTAAYTGNELVIVGFATSMNDNIKIYRGAGDVIQSGVTVPHWVSPLMSMAVPTNTGGLFRVNATVDSSGNMSEGTFVVEGVLREASDNTPVTESKVQLLKGSLTRIDMLLAGAGKLEFLAKVDARHDSMASAYDVDDVVGIMFDAGAANGFSFLTDFMRNGMQGVADIGRPVPEPTSVGLFASMLVLGVAGLRKKRRACA